MEFDPEQLRQQYASFTDEALLEIDSDELVEGARQCYEDELRRRRLRGTPSAQGTPIEQPWAGEKEPEWAAEGMVAMSCSDLVVLEARAVLLRAGIPCFVANREAEAAGGPPSFDILVQPSQHLLALSVLDRDLFNPQLVEEWQTHFAALSDDELMEMDADLLVAGMRDRIDRLVRAYEDELLKRGLAELETDSGG